MFPTTFVCARAPGIRPASTRARSTSRRAMPPLFMMLPAKMNSGTASSEKLSIPTFICWPMTYVASSHLRNTSAVRNEATPSPTEMGTPTASRTKNAPNRTATAVRASISQFPPGRPWGPR
jgi:hypothetical protein